ncbi:hypothetical protein ACF09G_35800 [Streptomyces albogriseolus]|uniref:hypothetical protein n=1 Tax=Streptomyces albogriseolus TaxID=1887 RepID=UPI0037035763
MGVIRLATTGQTNDNLNHFAAWANRYCDSHRRHDTFAPGSLATRTAIRASSSPSTPGGCTTS